MGLALSFEYSSRFIVSAGYSQVFDLLSDVPSALSLHPNTEEVIKIEENVYKVLMKRIGTPKHYFQFSYTSVYDSSRENGVICWKPHSIDDKLQIDGSFKLSAVSDDATGVQIDVKSEMELGLPRFMRGLTYRFIKEDNDRVWASFAENVNGFFSS